MKSAPKKLTAAAKVHWRRLQKEDVDASPDLLAAYCTTLAQYDEAQEKIEEFGLVVVTFTGVAAPNSYLGVADMLLGKILRMQKMLGISED